MAKQIKTVKCPQCGSVKKKSIKEDYYRCESCGTEYFLDSDDINIHVDHQLNNQGSQPQVDFSRALKVAGVTIGSFSVAFLLIIFIFIGFGSSSRHSTSRPGQSEQSDAFWESTMCVRLFPANEKDKAVLFYVGRRQYKRSGKSRNGSYAVFRDVETGKILKEYRLPEEEATAEYRYFRSTGKHYVIVNGQFLYEVDPERYGFGKVEETLFLQQPEFSSGVASVKFVYGTGDGFVVVTNLGKEFKFYPGRNAVYKTDDPKARHWSKESLWPDATEKVHYLFTEKSSDYPDDGVQLMKIMYLYNNGGPAYLPTKTEWENKLVWEGSHTFHKKQLEDASSYRFVSYRDFTPGRTYIDPKVLYYDDAHVLIADKPTAAPDAVPGLQLLDTEGKLLWTQQGLYTIDSHWWDDAVLKTGEYLWVCISDRPIKILRIKMDGSDPKIFMPNGDN